MKNEIIEIKEEITIGEVVLEEGDRIKVLSERSDDCLRATFEIEGTVSGGGRFTGEHLSGAIGSGYYGDLDLSIQYYPSDGDFLGDGKWYFCPDEDLDMDTVEDYITSIIDENSAGEWGIVDSYQIKNMRIL